MSLTSVEFAFASKNATTTTISDQSTTTESTASAEIVASPSLGEDGEWWWWLLIAIGVALMCVCAAIVLLLGIRKQRAHQHGQQADEPNANDASPITTTSIYASVAMSSEYNSVVYDTAFAEKMPTSTYASMPTFEDYQKGL